MTPNSACIFFVLAMIAVLIPSREPIPLPASSLCLLYLLIDSRREAWKSLVFALKVVAPIAALLSIIWIGLIGSAPMEVAWLAPIDQQTPVAYVVRISFRLFLFALLVDAVLVRSMTDSALLFVSRLSLPVSIKQVIAMTLAIASSIRAAADRSRVALIAANLITPERSIRNVRHLWLFLQTVWLFIISSVSDKLQTKWKIEQITTVLAERLARPEGKVSSAHDFIWLTLASIAVVASLLMTYL